MVEYEHQSLDKIFQALSDPTRRSMLKQLAEMEYTVSELAVYYDMSLAAVSKHLKVLEDAGLIVKRKDGRFYHCRMNFEPLERVIELVREYLVFVRRETL